MSDITLLEGKLYAAMASGDPKVIARAVAAVEQVLNSGEGFSGDGYNSLTGLLMQAQAMCDVSALPVANLAGIASSSTLPATPFERSVAENFSREERAYYDSYTPGEQYKVQHTNPDGTVTTDTVDGGKIRGAVADTKYYALTEEQRKKVDAQQPGAEEQRKEDAAHPEKAAEREMSKMGELHSSLNVLQSRREFELRSSGKSEAEVQTMSQKFTVAHTKVDSVINAIAAKEKKEAPAGLSELSESARKAVLAALPEKLEHDVKNAKDDLSFTLQHDILDDAMGLKSDSKGKFESKDVDGHTPSFTFVPGQNNQTGLGGFTPH